MKEKAKELTQVYEGLHEEAKDSLKGLGKLIEKSSMSLEEVVELIDNKMEADVFHPELKSIEEMTSEEFSALYNIQTGHKGCGACPGVEGGVEPYLC